MVKSGISLRVLTLNATVILQVHAADFVCGPAERIAGNWSAVTVS